MPIASWKAGSVMIMKAMAWGKVSDLHQRKETVHLGSVQLLIDKIFQLPHFTVTKATSGSCLLRYTAPHPYRPRPLPFCHPTSLAHNRYAARSGNKHQSKSSGSHFFVPLLLARLAEGFPPHRLTRQPLLRLLGQAHLYLYYPIR